MSDEMRCPRCSEITLTALPHTNQDRIIEWECPCGGLFNFPNENFDPSPQEQWEVTEVEGVDARDYRLTKDHTRTRT